MAFFEKFGKKLDSAGLEIKLQTKILADTMRLNSAISEKEKQINRLYYDIGRSYYENHKNDLASEERDGINSVNSLLEEIDRLKSDINRLKNADIVKCPNCGSDVIPENEFCTCCGQAIVKSDKSGKSEQAAGITTARICPSCGHTMEDDNLFCMNCGTRL